MTQPASQPHPPQSPDVSDTASRLIELIGALRSVAVAYSGGVDSAVVAMAARLALGDQAVAVTAVSPSLAAVERDTARREAALIGIRHVELPTNEFDNPRYRANAGDRCFFCKDTLYRLTRAQLDTLPAEWLLNGTNSDDLGDHRPGLQAAADHHVRSPLVELQCSKQRVRQLARYWNLRVAEKPAAPCLSSRVAYGVEVTAERVRRIELAEAFVRRLIPEGNLRVRCEDGEQARIEVDLPHVATLQQPDLRTAVSAELRRLGFRSVMVDPAGFRSGNLNQSLPLISLNTPERTNL